MSAAAEVVTADALRQEARAQARKFTQRQRNEGYRPSALYEYTDAEGYPLFWRIRLDHPDGGKWIRPMHRDDSGTWQLSEPELGKKPLYRLQDIAGSTQPVFVVEGEKCADSLAGLGVTSTTSGSSSSANAADWFPLQGRDVLIWPDNDAGGYGYAQDVCTALEDLAGRVRLISIDELGLPEKGDAADWLAAHPEAGIDDVMALPSVEPCDYFERSGDTGDSGDNAENTGDSASPVASEESGDTGDELPFGFAMNESGVWFYPPQEPDKEPPNPIWVCSPLRVTALTRNSDGEAWGRLLEFRDPDGALHCWPCPMEMLASDGSDFRRILLSLGLEIAPASKARQYLATYVQTAEVSRRAVCTNRTGWYRDVFVLPDETIGESDERVLLQVLGEPPKMRQTATAEEWRDNVASLCIGNSRLILAVSAAFAGPLLTIVGQEAGGLNFVGSSSTGKTTALKVAASVWGGADYLHRWRATANGLEAIAQGHNDSLLVLDELAQMDPRQAGEAAYMLANGSGKQRARRDGQARKAASWRLLFLSAGEIGLADHMAEAGKRTRAGQEVRLADIPADAGAGHGLFESLHGYASAGAFSDGLSQATSRYYGTAARAYLRNITVMPREAISERVNALINDFTSDVLPEGAEGQAKRVCARFGLIAAGGELASKLGLTGWPVGAAAKAAAECFQAWLDRRGGTGSQEEAQAIAQVVHFIQSHGEARFSDLNGSHDRPVAHRAGYRRDVGGEIQYLIFSEVFKREVCAGLDYRAVARALRAKGMLVTEEADRHTIKPRNLGRVFAIREVDNDES